MELGPGRGTLTCDILGATKDQGSFTTINCHLVDVSPALRKIQQEKIFDMFTKWNSPLTYKEQDGREMLFMENFTATWYKSFSEVSARLALSRNPGLIVAHELFDALPVHQFEYDGSEWLERRVVLEDEKFVLQPRPHENVEKILKPEKVFVDAKLSTGDRYELAYDSLVLMN